MHFDKTYIFHYHVDIIYWYCRWTEKILLIVLSFLKNYWQSIPYWENTASF